MKLFSISALSLGYTAHLATAQYQPVYVNYLNNLETSETAVNVWSTDFSKRYGHNCSTKLVSGTFEDLPITFIVNAQGVGSINVDGINLTVSANGTLICGSIVNETEVVLSCPLTLPSTIKLEELSDEEVEECFSEGSLDLETQGKEFWDSGDGSDEIDEVEVDVDEDSDSDSDDEVEVSQDIETDDDGDDDTEDDTDFNDEFDSDDDTDGVFDESDDSDDEKDDVVVVDDDDDDDDEKEDDSDDEKDGDDSDD